MEIRKNPLVDGEYYHIITRSIAKYIVFNESQDYQRIISILGLCRYKEFNYRFSQFLKLSPDMQKAVTKEIHKSKHFLVEIVAYCIMPTHIHLVLKQIGDNGISKFMSRVLNSYSKYFNTKHLRKGPLWEGPFKNILVSKDEYLIHLTRYIHLNPVSTGLVEDLETWQYSSYSEYINKAKNDLCVFKEIIDMEPTKYKKFVCARKTYQRTLSLIKHLALENYTG